MLFFNSYTKDLEGLHARLSQGVMRFHEASCDDCYQGCDKRFCKG